MSTSRHAERVCVTSLSQRLLCTRQQSDCIVFYKIPLKYLLWVFSTFRNHLSLVSNFNIN